MIRRDPMLAQLGDYLRSVREARGWSQEQLALKCGLNRTYMGGVERGEYNMTLLTLRKLTDALGISILDAAKGMLKEEKRRR